MNRPLQVGVTGGIGSGKSLVCRIFQSLGVAVYNADNRAKELMTIDPVLVEQIKKEFGAKAYFSDGKVNRDFIAQAVFGASDQLEKLNHFVHPRVLVDYAKWVEGRQNESYVIKEAALIFEAGSSSGLDTIIVVFAPEALRLKRVLQRDAHRSEKDILNIFHNQMPEEEKLKRADAVIVNDESRLVIPQVLKLHNQFLSRA